MCGDRTAALSSFDTASVVGAKTALLKSPGTVEIAGAETIRATTAGDFDVAAKLVRIVGGYYPEAEAPPLDEATSIGVMARRDLRFMSIEHCIVLCAKKNLLATAHAGDARIKAKKMVAITGGSIVGSAGTVTFTSSGDTEVRADGNVKVVAGGNVSVEAGGDVTVVGATVTVQAGSITLDGPTTVNGDLTVAGAIHGG